MRPCLFLGSAVGDGVGMGTTLTLLGLLEPVAVGAHLQDINVVGQSVEQCVG